MNINSKKVIAKNIPLNSKNASLSSAEKYEELILGVFFKDYFRHKNFWYDFLLHRVSSYDFFSIKEFFHLIIAYDMEVILDFFFIFYL